MHLPVCASRLRSCVCARALHTDVTKAEVAAGMLPMLCACAGERETVLARTERHTTSELHVGQKVIKCTPLENASSRNSPGAFNNFECNANFGFRSNKKAENVVFVSLHSEKKDFIYLYFII